ncbi:MAG: MOSC domain-containing protein [Acidobacteriota bacterium]
MPRVLHVSRQQAHIFSKTPQTSIRVIAGEGVEGDAHCGVTTQHLYLQRKDPTLPNLCQVHLLASEKLAALAVKGYLVHPGDLGENILTQNLDLLSLPTGTLLHIGADAVLEVTGLRTPCIQIDKFRAGLQQHMWLGHSSPGQHSQDAGIMSIVRTTGLIHPGDYIRVELPPKPHKPLQPV